MEKVLRDPEERLGQALRFYSQSDIGRWCEFLSCDEETLLRLWRLLALALTVEMGQNPLLQNAQEVIWCSANTVPLLADGSMVDVPDTLEKQRQSIYARLGLQPRYLGYNWHEAATMGEFLQEISWDWVSRLGFKLQQPSAHEVGFVIDELTTFLEEGV